MTKKERRRMKALEMIGSGREPLVVEKGLDPQRLAALSAQIVQQTTEVKTAPVGIGDLRKPITVVVAGNGLFQLRQTRVGVVTVRLGAGVKGLPEQPTVFELNVPRVPWETFALAVAFFRRVWKQRKTESMVRGYYHARNGWALHVPTQTVTSGSVKVDPNEPDPGIGEWLLDLHSHPGSSSKFSGTDDEDEQTERIFGCVADLDGLPNWHWRIGTGLELWQDVGLTDVVEVPEGDVEVLVPWTMVLSGSRINPFLKYADDVPQAWLEKVTEPQRVGMVSGFNGMGRVMGKSLDRLVRDSESGFRPMWSRETDTQPDLYEEHFGGI